MNGPYERTLIILKPDAVQRRIVGEVISRFERKGLSIAALKMMRVDEKLARKHYAAHEGKDFYEPLVQFITSSPVVVMVLEGIEAIATSRKMMGATFGRDADPGTIRGDYGVSRRFNLIHGSDSLEAAQFEISLYFSPEEIPGIDHADMPWVYDLTGPEPV